MLHSIVYRLFVPKELILDKDISGYDLAVYAALRRFGFNPACEKLLFHSDSITYLLVGDCNKEQSIKCKQSIIKLFNSSYVSGEILQGERLFVLDTKESMDVKENFIEVYYDDVQKIIHSSNPNKFNLLKHFLVVMSTCFSDTKVSRMWQSWFADMSGKDEITISRYDKMLENMKLLYIRRDPWNKKANLYGHYKNKAKVDEYARNANYDSKPKETYANDGRRLSQIYNQMLKGKKYPSPIVQQVRDYMKQRNEKYRALAEKYPTGNYKEKIIDIDTIKY